MIDSISITDRENYINLFPLPSLKQHKSDQIVNRTVEKAKALLYQSAMGKLDPRALNLMFMAETALKNGNTPAASNFANKALKILKSKEGVDIERKYSSQEQKPSTILNSNFEQVEKQKHIKHSYKDISNDPGVSFTYTTSLTGPQSFIAVPAHEAEHVRRRVSEAVFNGERVMVLVSYKVRYDPETGQSYMAGGTTRTIKISDHKRDNPYRGTRVDMYI